MKAHRSASQIFQKRPSPVHLSVSLAVKDFAARVRLGR